MGKIPKLTGKPPSPACFHSISFPSKWESLKEFLRRNNIPCFHSISFPSKWESAEKNFLIQICEENVSIQLVFPASGKVRALKRLLALYSTKDFDRSFFYPHFSLCFWYIFSSTQQCPTLKFSIALGSSVSDGTLRKIASTSTRQKCLVWNVT